MSVVNATVRLIIVICTVDIVEGSVNGMDYHIEKCKCGAKGRLRTSEEYAWVECKKKCGVHTGLYREENIEIAKQKVVAYWNRLVKKDG